MARKAKHLLLALLVLTSSILGAMPFKPACSDFTCKVECPMHKKPAAKRDCCQKEVKQATLSEVCKCPKYSAATVSIALFQSKFALKIPPAVDWLPAPDFELPEPLITKEIQRFTPATGPPGLGFHHTDSSRAPPHLSS